MTLLIERGLTNRARRPTAKGSGIESGPIRLAKADSIGRPVDEEHGPDQLVARHGAPRAGVARLGAVVAHHEIAVPRVPDLAEVLAVGKSPGSGEVRLLQLHELLGPTAL